MFCVCLCLLHVYRSQKKVETPLASQPQLARHAAQKEEYRNSVCIIKHHQEHSRGKEKPASRFREEKGKSDTALRGDILCCNAVGYC